jgi:outer membrane protein TolC
MRTAWNVSLALVVACTLPAGLRAADKKDAKLKELLKERLATLGTLAKVATAEYQTGRGSFDRLHQVKQALLKAELEMCASDKERIKVLEEFVAQAKAYEKTAVQRYKSGVGSQSDTLMATAARLEAEIALERVKEGGKVGK